MTNNSVTDVTAFVDQLIIIRTLVAYLGETHQKGWWASSFLGPGSRTFVSPIFAKTQLLARIHGATQAAARAHDERIGVGAVYHLFRLPEDLEQDIQQAFYDTAHPDDTVPADRRNRLESLLTDAAAVTQQLHALAMPAVSSSQGPVRIGSVSDLRNPDVWTMVAAHYRQAFDQGIQTYPYLADWPS